MKINFKLFYLIVLAPVIFASCATPETKTTAPDATIDLEKLKPEIQAKEDAFAAGEKAKNVDAVAAYYSSDATSYNRNEAPSVGMAAIKEKIAKGFTKDSTGSYNVYKLVDLFAEGNSATEIGSFTKMNAAGAEIEKGYYMSYFQKRDGKYVCVRDMSVTETAAKPGM